MALFPLHRSPSQWPDFLFSGLWTVVVCFPFLRIFSPSFLFPSSSVTPASNTQEKELTFLLRDMSIPPHIAFNDAVLGRTDNPARALPQDAILALLSLALPAPYAVALIMSGAAFIGTWSCLQWGREIQDLLGFQGGFFSSFLLRIPSSLYLLWNPYSAERLLQGHWSLVIAVWLLPALIYAIYRKSWSLVILLYLLCSLTPTGWLCATIVALVSSFSLYSSKLFFSHRSPIVSLLIPTLIIFLAASPWLLPSILSPSRTIVDATTAAIFAPQWGSKDSFFNLLSLGGIWNEQAVPDSLRTFSPWTTLAGSILSITTLFTLSALSFRTHSSSIPPLVLLLRGITLLTVFSLGAVIFSATPWGISLSSWLISHIPGAGLIRDTQKFLGIALPGYALGLCACSIFFFRLINSLYTLPLTRIVPRFFRPRPLPSGSLLPSTVLSSTFCGVLILMTVPALPQDISPLSPVVFPSELSDIADITADDPGSVLILPPGNYLTIEVEDVKGKKQNPLVYDPVLKMLSGNPIDPGYLIIDGSLYDGNSQAMSVLAHTMRGEDRLSLFGIDWVLVRGELEPPVEKMMSSYPVFYDSETINDFDDYWGTHSHLNQEIQGRDTTENTKEQHQRWRLYRISSSSS